MGVPYRAPSLFDPRSPFSLFDYCIRSHAQAQYELIPGPLEEVGFGMDQLDLDTACI